MQKGDKVLEPHSFLPSFIDPLIGITVTKGPSESVFSPGDCVFAPLTDLYPSKESLKNKSLPNYNVLLYLLDVKTTGFG